MAKTNVEVKLVSEDGNAFTIMGKVSHKLRKAGYDKQFIDEYIAKATKGDYSHLLRTTMEYVIVS